MASRAFVALHALILVLWICFTAANMCDGSDGEYCLPYQRCCQYTASSVSDDAGQESTDITNDLSHVKDEPNAQYIWKCCPYIRGTCCKDNFDYCCPPNFDCVATTRRWLRRGVKDFASTAVKRFLEEEDDVPMLEMYTATIFGPM